MTESNIIHSTFAVARRIPADPARVYQAFADPDLKRRWFAESEQHVVEEFTSRLEPGASERLRYRFKDGTPFAGMSISNTDTVIEVVPEQRIISASTMRFEDNCISVALTTTELIPDEDGTELRLTFQGAFLPGADGPEIREMGWQALLDRLSGLFAEAEVRAG